MDQETNDQLPSLDFIAGLITGEGAFMWIHQGGRRLPVFQLRMHASERPLFEQIRKKLNIFEPIHEYTQSGRHSVLLLIRRRSTIENVIIPVFNGRLFGKKAAQFELWKGIIEHEQLLRLGINSDY